MHPPAFWHIPGHPLAALLEPFGWVYGAITSARAGKSPIYKAPVPVICVGNIIAGGAGKTPTALAIGTVLATMGKNIHFLSRGYGGTEQGPLLVDKDEHSAELVGDEPILLAQQAPTWVAKDRAAGAEAAVDAGADCIVLDDGFQNPSVHKDLSIVVVDGGYGFGNGAMIPAGPLRESIAKGLKRANAALIVGADETGAEQRIGQACPILRANIVPSDDARRFKGKRVIGFAGIGRPEKFFETLASTGAEIVDELTFDDHEPYSIERVVAMMRHASAIKATLVTTSKDFVRLPKNRRNGIEVLTITLAMNDQTALEKLLTPLFDHG